MERYLAEKKLIPTHSDTQYLDESWLQMDVMEHCRNQIEANIGQSNSIFPRKCLLGYVMSITNENLRSAND